VIEPTAPGGQAGSSSRIENYLGFPTGVSGQELADRAAAQAARFGAETAVGRRVTRLDCGPSIHRVTLDGGETVPARAVVIATGARYRLPEVAGLDRFEGSGVYYAATHLEARLCGGAQVVILGGGNSAGQAAVFLAERAQEVTIAVRGEGLSATMSRYLIDRIERTPNIRLSPFTEIAGVHGTGRLEALDLRREGRVERVAATHLFIFIGAEPNVDFASARLARDARGFLKTGADLTEAELAAAGWPPGRRPMLLESSCPRVFVAGDVRSGSTKRVAAAVGEGALAVSFVHRALGP
jgi:thioredoxin reductase (NADPH)